MYNINEIIRKNFFGRVEVIKIKTKDFFGILTNFQVTPLNIFSRTQHCAQIAKSIFI